MRELWEWVSKKLYNKKKEREGGGEEEVHIQAGEAIIIQNVRRCQFKGKC